MKSNVYMCYSVNLRDFLNNNGLRYEVAAINPNRDNKMFWLYLRSKKLDMLLEEWSSRK